MYGELQEHLNCAFVGANTPVILRFEAATASGGMMVEEFRDARPWIKLYGDVGEAKAQFLTGLEGFAEYLDILERHDLIRCDGCWNKLCWFQVEIRQPRYRAILYGEGHSYRFSYICMCDRESMIVGLRLAYDRLKAVYETFFYTKIDAAD